MYRILIISALRAMRTVAAVTFAAVVAPAGTLANAMIYNTEDVPEVTTEVACAGAMESTLAGALESALIVAPLNTFLVTPVDAPAYDLVYASFGTMENTNADVPEGTSAGAVMGAQLDAHLGINIDTPEVPPVDALAIVPEIVLAGAWTNATLDVPENTIKDAPAVARLGAPESVLAGARTNATSGVPENTIKDATAVTRLGAPESVLAGARTNATSGVPENTIKDAPAVARLGAPENIPAVTPFGVLEGITAVATLGDPPGASAFAESDTPPGDPMRANSVSPAKVPEGEAPGAPANALVHILADITAHTSEYLIPYTPSDNFLNTPAGALEHTPEQPSLLHTDSLTYALYLNKEWKALLTETRRALSEGVDFYYLRVRAGIAAYELKNYRLAAMHLAKAYEWNTSDELVNYWYYYALLMGSRADEANALAETFPPQFLQRMEIRPKRGVNSLTAEAQVSVNTDHASLLEDAIGGSSYLAYRNVLKRQTYKGFGIDHRAAPRLYTFHGISHLGIDRMQMYRSPTLDYQVENSAWQFQYYLQGRYLLPKGWSVTSAATLLLGSALSHWLSFSNSGVPIPNASTYSISDGFVSASVAKELTHLRPKFSVSYGKVSGYRQLQATGQLLFYPAGNPNFYLSSSYTLHRDESNPDLKTIFSPRAGLKTGPLWWSAGVSTGVMKHFSASDGYVVYNMPESISGLYDISVYLPLLKYRLGVTARYQVADKEGSTFDYSNATRYTTAPYTFTENSFLISIRYNL